MPTAGPIIRTKLRVPITRPELVSRPRLQTEIARGLCGPLTLVAAPAGFGKTTLLASSLTGCEAHVAWLSLDANDSQTGRFLGYLIASLREVDPTLVGEAAHLAAAAQQAPPEAILTTLINSLDASGRELILVLDDYQFIKSQAVHEAVAFLLEHCPRSLHMVISSRSDPPLPLARLRARGQTVELRGADLSFTQPEAAQFLNDVMGLQLDAEAVAALDERTEGWIAGLQMAALSMRDRKDVFGFIEGFSGTNRYILDYLLEEVLAGQSPEIQHFLLFTSILERLTAPLCDDIVSAGPASRGSEIEAGVQPAQAESLFVRRSASTLEYLERANLFLVPLDDERRWFRYHHLFADLLRARLDQLYPGLARQLHARAAAWLESEGLTVEAVNHTLAAGDYDRAARLVEENTGRLLALGEINTLMGWIETLPAELRLARPWLCLHQAYALMFAGRPAEVGPLLAQAEAAIEAPPCRRVAIQEGTDGLAGDHAAGPEISAEEVRALKGAVAAARAFTAVTMGEDAEGLSQARQARKLLDPDELFNRSLVAWAVGRTMLTEGHLPEARVAFEEQVRLGRKIGNPWTFLAGKSYLTQVLQAQGELRKARAQMEEALAEAGRQGARSRGYIAWVENELASVLYEQNEIEAAKRLVDEAIVLTRQWPNPNHLVYAYVLQARLLLAQGDLQGARIATGELDRIRREAQLTRWLRRTAECEVVRTLTALNSAGISQAPGDPLAEECAVFVESWRNELAHLYESGKPPIDKCSQVSAFTLARVALAAGRPEEALAVLAPVTLAARGAGHTAAVISSLVLTAVAGSAGQNPRGMPSARARGTVRERAPLADLEEALRLAEPGGYVRVFLDQGLPMRALLAQWLASCGDSPLRSYAAHILSQFDAEPHAAAQRESEPLPGSLVEPLSPRELEVLHLVALGKTNAEIALQLIVAPGTVKAHTASIYHKLDAGNRTEAVARARQLGILP